MLDRSGYNLQDFLDKLPANGKSTVPQGTTVLAFHYEDGVIVAGDRRILAGSNLMFERCEKIIPIDTYSLMAVAGVPAIAFEISRILSQYFEYYRRTQVRPMSLEGKIRTFSKLLKENLTASTSGLTRVSPIFATFDIETGKPSIFYYDMLGAEFQVLSFTATGAGAGHIRDVLERENQWGPKPLAQRCEKDAAVIAMKLLNVAAQMDNQEKNALGDVQIYPILAKVTENGYQFWSDDQMTLLESMARGER
ncbi:MAG: proteasome subunit alpha [Nitrospinota bacterium]